MSTCPTSNSQVTFWTQELCNAATQLSHAAQDLDHRVNEKGGMKPDPLLILRRLSNLEKELKELENECSVMVDTKNTVVTELLQVQLENSSLLETLSELTGSSTAIHDNHFRKEVVSKIQRQAILWDNLECDEGI